MVFICINCLSILMKYSSACNIQLQSIQVKIVSIEACSGKIPPPLPIKKLHKEKKKTSGYVLREDISWPNKKKQKQKQQNNKNKETKKQTSPPQKKGKENLKIQQFNG